MGTTRGIFLSGWTHLSKKGEKITPGHSSYTKLVRTYIADNYKGGSAKDFVEKQLIPFMYKIIQEAKDKGEGINDVAQRYLNNSKK